MKTIDEFFTVNADFTRFFIKEGIRKKSFQEYKSNAEGVLKLAMLPI
ncbi:hypothetical protein GGGNBK_08445 [Sporosarcina sp. ANT_H38]